MRAASIFILIAAASLSGCLDSDSSMDSLSEDEGTGASVDQTSPPILISSFWQRVGYGIDTYKPEAVCNTSAPEPIGRPNDKYYMGRMGRVTSNHTEILFDISIENDFSEMGISGFRIMAYYNHTLVFATEPLMESVQFSYPVDGTMLDLDDDRRWTFFFKLTDPLTADDPDACTSGHWRGEVEFNIYAASG